jgi:CheY-like chemotaxis protein
MDVQMPLMDGLETTQHIRNPDSTVIDHDIPVIAMTAHAMKGDKEQCLDAGMNDYISKPISAEQLFFLMEKWSSIILKRNTETNIQKNSPISENRLQIFVKEKFMERMAGDYNLVNEITSMFLNNIPVIIANMKKAADIDNMDEVSSYAHSIKGSSANIGGDVLSDIAAKIEKLGRSGKTTEIQTLIPELEKQFELLAEELNNL